MQLLFRAIVCFGLYVAFILLPLGVALLTDPVTQGRPPLLEFGVAIGFVGFTVMAFEFALVGRLRAAAEPFGVDALMQFHRQMGIAAFVFILAHVLILFRFRLVPTMLNPFASDATAQSGAIALWGLVILVASTAWRARMRLRYEVWQCIHALAAITVVTASLVHVMEVNRYSSAPVLRAILVMYVLLFVALLIRYRILRPLCLWRRPWEVVENRNEGGDTRTLIIHPTGHAGLVFNPGQFVWLATARHPFAIEQHPISIASSAERPQRLELSIKALGDWSGKIVPDVAAGRRVWIDGGYGAFTPDRTPGQGFMLIAGGIGITPMSSILLTMRDRGDVRPVTLLYAANSPARMIYAKELKALESVLSLTCVLVFESPPAQWQGERGFITTDMLRRHLPTPAVRYHYFVCGPNPMMDSVESSLLELGVPASRISTERFKMG